MDPPPPPPEAGLPTTAGAPPAGGVAAAEGQPPPPPDGATARGVEGVDRTEAEEADCTEVRRTTASNGGMTP